MKTRLALTAPFVLVAVLLLGAAPAYAGLITYDDFSDGDLVGWHVDEGNWTVKNGELSIRRVDYWDVSDYKLILVDGLDVGTFSLEVWLNPVNDSGAVAFWRQGWPTQMEVALSYYTNSLTITEVVNTDVMSFYGYGDNDGVRWQSNT